RPYVEGVQRAGSRDRRHARRRGRETRPVPVDRHLPELGAAGCLRDHQQMVLVVPGHGRWAGEVGAEWRRLGDEDAAPAALDRPKHQMSSRAPADDESDTDPVRGDSEPGHRARAGGQADADLHRFSRGARWYRPDAPRAVDLARDPDIADAVPA